MRPSARIQDVLEWAGVEFSEGERPGVRLKRLKRGGGDAD